MDLKRVYFVRHGESEDDSQEIHQRFESPLSENGQHEVALLAGRFSHTPFDVVLSSSLIRAQETSEAIATLSHKKVEVDDLFAEIRKPSQLLGQKRDDPQFDSLRAVLSEKWSYPAWHYSDEENFKDVKRRALDALAILVKRKEEQIVVITHGHFLTILFLVMALGKEVTADEFTTFDTFFHTENASISLCEYSTRGWKMRTWNDVTHLTELIH